MTIDVSGWTDTSSIEAWLRDQSHRDDAALDLTAMALALALHGRPHADPKLYVDHLDALVDGAANFPGARDAVEPAAQVAAINAAMFSRHGYRGDADNYDDLANADLTRVIDRRKGLPITLSILFLHVARSLGWAAWGVGFPGHFLVKVGRGDDRLIVDPFARGAAVGRPRLVELLRRVHGDEAKLADEHLAEARNRDILFRVQHNIVLRCRRRGDAATALAAVDRAILIEPARAALWLEAAQLSAEIGQLMKARNCLDAVARFDADRHFAARAGALRAQLNTRLN